MGSKSHLIATLLEKCYKVCERTEIFLSQNSAEEKSATAPFDKPSTSCVIWLEKIKFDPFKGDLRKYPKFKEEFLKHIEPLYKPSEEAFVLRHYLSDEVRNEVEGLGENIKQIWERLDEKNGEEGKLVDAIVSEIKKLKGSVDTDYKRMLEMINVIKRVQIDLKSLSLEREIQNPLRRSR